MAYTPLLPGLCQLSCLCLHQATSWHAIQCYTSCLNKMADGTLIWVWGRGGRGGGVGEGRVFGWNIPPPVSSLIPYPSQTHPHTSSPTPHPHTHTPGGVLEETLRRDMALVWNCTCSTDLGVVRNAISMATWVSFPPCGLT